MRGIAITDAGVEVLDGLAEPQPAEGEILVRVLAVGLCGTDVTLAAGRREVPFKPWVLGHEAVGEVVSVGPGVSGWWPRDLAVLEPNLPCLACAACERGFTSACSRRASAGVKTQPGFMTEFVSHPAEFTFKAPSTTPIEDLVCAEPMAVARSAVRRSGIEPGSSALILGAGAQGLFTVQILTTMGVVPAVTDLDAERVRLAVRHGAVDLNDDDRAYDHVFDAVGAPAALRAALDRAALGCRVTVVGESHDPLPLSSLELVQKQLTLRGSFIYDHPVDFQSTLKAITQGRVRPHEVLQDPLSLDDAARWLRRPFGAGKAWVDLR